MLASHRARSLAVAFVAAIALVAACTPRAHTTAVAAGPPSTNTGAPPPAADPPPPVADTPPTAQPFAWDRVLVVGWEQVGGPGLAGVAKVEQRLSVMIGEGPPTPARVVDVNRDLCDEGGPPDTCVFVGVELGSERDPVDPDALPSLWKEPGAPDDDALEDVALLDARLAVAADTALPRFVPHTLEVHYANALCEGDVDSRDHVLLRTYSSAGADPLRDVPALRDWRRYPRRVVTLRARDRTLHFVTVSKVKRPRSGRMSDVGKYETAFWILEDVGSATNVLHHERQKDARNMNTDTSCQLPLRYPTPWSVVESDGVVHVLTRSNITHFQRWSLQADRLTREGEWKADVNPLG